MSKLSFLVIIFSILSYSNLFGQIEAKLYTGVYDRHGLAVEYSVNDRLGIEIGGSFRTKKTSNFYINADVVNRENNIYLNSKMKRYSAKKYANLGIFYGAYLRYWQKFETVADIETWTAEQKNDAENINGWISTRTHKTSLGFIFGYKGKILESIAWEISIGVGASPPFLYTEREITTQENIKRRIGGDAHVGYLNHLSLLTHLSVGYRF